MREKLLKKFEEVFGDSKDCRVYFAPGRVNLIGEHTDYNGGHVFPCALTIGTYGVARKNGGRKLRFFSMNFENMGVIKTEPLSQADEAAGWANYPLGVIWAFGGRGMNIPCGFDLLLYGNIPNGSGLSSSASVEVLTGAVLRDLFDFPVSNLDLAKIGQYSENNFNRVNCGIMDQFAIAMGKAETAVYLDTSTLSFEYVPVRLKDLSLVISCSNKKRGLGDSKYNERRAECEKALSELQTELDIQTLGDLDEAAFEAHKNLIGSDTRIRRARHAVTENQRTIRAVTALQNDDFTTFGELMNESHRSLRDDYEVTGSELDTLVDEAWKCPGVLGSRMTGAGFGGCSVSLVRNDAVDRFIENVGAAYREKIGYSADFYIVSAGDGPHRLAPY